MSDDDYTPCQGAHDEPCSDPDCYVHEARKLAADFAAKTPLPRPGIGIAEIAVELERGKNIAILPLRAPAIVRAAAFWLQKPAVLGANAMRVTEKIAQPILFVECDPAGELREHVFAFLPSNAPFEPREGYRAEYRTSAIQAGVGCVHVFELVKEEP